MGSSIIKDLSHLKKKRFSTKSYFTNLMYKKSAGNIDDYVDHEIYLKIAKDYYRPNGKNFLLEDKIVFQEHLKIVSVPPTTSSIVGNYFLKLLFLLYFLKILRV